MYVNHIICWFLYCLGAGSSSNWCSDTYRGGSANSEPEAQAVIAAVAEAGDVRSYLSIHSYSQLLLVPHAYAAVKAPDYNELVKRLFFWHHYTV